MREKELEKSHFSQTVVTAILAIAIAFMMSGIWHMYVKPLIREIARS